MDDMGQATALKMVDGGFAARHDQVSGMA